MNFNAKSLADNWKKFKRNFRVYYDAAQLQKKGLTQVAILLYCAGEGGSDRFEKFEFSDSGQDKRAIFKHSWKSSEICVNQERIFFMTHISSFKKSNYQVNLLNVF